MQDGGPTVHGAAVRVEQTALGTVSWAQARKNEPSL